MTRLPACPPACPQSAQKTAPGPPPFPSCWRPCWPAAAPKTARLRRSRCQQKPTVRQSRRQSRPGWRRLCNGKRPSWKPPLECRSAPAEQTAFRRAAVVAGKIAKPEDRVALVARVDIRRAPGVHRPGALIPVAESGLESGPPGGDIRAGCQRGRHRDRRRARAAACVNTAAIGEWRAGGKRAGRGEDQGCNQKSCLHGVLPWRSAPWHDRLRGSVALKYTPSCRAGMTPLFNSLCARSGGLRGRLQAGRRKPTFRI